MNDYAENKESSYLQYCYVNHLYGWMMSQKLPVKNFKWITDISKFDEGFIKSYNEESDTGYFLEVDVQHPERLHDLYNDLPLLPKRIEIEKVEKLVLDLHDTAQNVIHIRSSKQALNG